MQLTTLFGLALSTLSLTSASPMNYPSRRDSAALTWHVSNFTTGCSPGGCVYNFNILGIATKYTPGFNTSCSGTTESSDDLVSCQNPLIKSRVKAEPYPLWNVRVEHEWIETGDAEFYAFGETNVTSSTPRFTIPVTEEYGVA
ncbi:uncharacterized protein BP01DRAFT_374834 [Aspergillus saccharolyticus JOP 1030-1]|uniref:Uncharacterized protein n=1 Tax=Aspergillus saccharolyticus JOP 1030-1 TaxID=1450539 RepID=A0A318ZI50_9EURO|nr:hypothetical protein BP01DRAFT_374834 [Aspergillus saccharolyticus JOP 1030-1]PYH44253.1 hypothetical protein BP01DRAFT_374834 [Aspergillus saccharolyticus JOP 1030-1]